MLTDDTLRLQRSDGRLPRAWIVRGGTAWDDLLFRALWLCGWEVRIVERTSNLHDVQLDLVVVALVSSNDDDAVACVECVECPTLVLATPLSGLGVENIARRAGVHVISFEAGLLEILQVCEEITTESLECVPVLELDKWIAP